MRIFVLTATYEVEKSTYVTTLVIFTRQTEKRNCKKILISP
jgi:hypothetical protein